MPSPIFARITALFKKDLSLFLFANALYSLSTGLISILSPYILRDTQTYEDFIYIFQNVMYLTSIFTAGFTVALLRYYKYNPSKYDFFYTLIVSAIIGVTFLLGLWQNNFLTQWLNLSTSSFSEHLLIYVSVGFSLLYVFNRAAFTAQERFRTIAVGILLIFILRLLALLYIGVSGTSHLALILLLVCILPMTNEILVLGKKWFSVKRTPMDGMGQFIAFALKTAVIGTIFLTSNRLLLISVKSYDSTIAASLSFANGMIGITTILSATISSFYIGRLDYKDPTAITAYLRKVKRCIPLFSALLVLASAAAFLFVWTTYPNHPVETAWICVITIMQAGIIFYLGLVTLLTKTYNCLNVQLAVNAVVCALVYTIISTLQHRIPIIPQYLFINLAIISGETILLIYVLRKHRADAEKPERPSNA